MMLAGWELGLENDPGIPNPTWNQICEALIRMDGDMLTDVSLTSIGNGCLLAGGGNGGRYIVVYFPQGTDEGDTLTLADLSLEGSEVELVAGGQLGEYPAKYCVDLPLVLRAFEHFFKTGELPSDLTWEPAWAQSL
jgi:hypothetical protein